MASKDKIILKAERLSNSKAWIDVFHGKKKIGAAIIDTAVWINNDRAALKRMIAALLEANKQKVPVSIVPLKGGLVNV